MRDRAAWTLATVLASALEAAAQVPIGPEFAVNFITTNGQFTPAIAMDAAGNFVVTWDSFIGGSVMNDVMGRRFTAGGVPIGLDFRVNQYTTNNQDHSRVASDAAGNFVVVWESYGQGTTESHVFARRFAANGAPIGDEFRVDPAGSGNHNSPDVAVEDTGAFLITWDFDRMTSSGREVWLARYDASGERQGSLWVVNDFSFGRQTKPRVAWQPGGRFVVVWESDADDNSGLAVRGRLFNEAGQPLGQEFTVNTYTTHNQYGPAIAVNAYGGFVVAWTSQAQDSLDPQHGPGVFAQQFSATGVRYPGELRANTYTTGVQARPAIGVDGTGAFTVVWNSGGEDGDFGGVFARRFFAGIPWPPFQVNSYTTQFQINPAIAVNPHGDFAVVWHSPQDGSGAGVVGRRFGPDLIFYDGLELQN
jgi:hypothetical protein